jgi:hypothetical protein
MWGRQFYLWARRHKGLFTRASHRGFLTEVQGMSRLTRRDLLRLSAAGVVGYSFSGWLQALAEDTAGVGERRRSCILLWMNGGPSQMDTFDLKPGHANGGPYRAIATSAEGVRISEHLPRLARQMHHAAIIRTMSTREGDHGQGSFLMHTGYLPRGPVQYPTLGSLVAREIGNDESALPNFVSIVPFRAFNPAAFSSGFLGPQYAPLLVGENANPFGAQNQPVDAAQALRVPDLLAPPEVETAHFDSRIDLLEQMQSDFARNHPSVAARSHHTAYNRAVRLMRTEARAAFNLDDEPAALRDAYGRSLFGQSCLLARRLVERGVPFVEVTLNGVPNAPAGWDTHGQNFDQVRRLSEVLDPAFATLLSDLADRGRLQDTTVVWMGEFGRTPRITNNQGRDHFPNAWSTVIAGGGVRGGQAFGRTSADGTTVEGPRPILTRDFLATVCRALGIDHTRQNMSNAGRPIRIAEQGALPIEEILA